VQELIDNLNTVVATVDKEGGKFSGAIDRLEKLISGLSNDRDTIGTAITALDNGTASIADLLGRARKPLGATVDQLNRMAPLLAQDPDIIDIALQKLPHNYKKLQRLGSYGAWFPYYLCGLELRVSDLQYRTVQVGLAHQTTGRCAEPKDPNE
jgi:phospholipid/cholesterol/gamma-HCH transport system substrate-binding protein